MDIMISDCMKKGTFKKFSIRNLSYAQSFLDKFRPDRDNKKIPQLGKMMRQREWKQEQSEHGRTNIPYLLVAVVERKREILSFFGSISGEHHFSLFFAFSRCE